MIFFSKLEQSDTWSLTSILENIFCKLSYNFYVYLLVAKPENPYEHRKILLKVCLPQFQIYEMVKTIIEDSVDIRISFYCYL